MSRNAPADRKLPTTQRQLRLLRALTASGDGLTVEDLAGMFGVSLKTIRRDLVRLRDGGFELHEDTERFGRRRWRVGDDPLGGVLSYDEAFALAVAIESIGSLAGTEIGEAARSAWTKIHSGLSETASNYLRRMARAITTLYARQVDYAEHEDQLLDLMIAVDERRICHIAYRSRRSTESITYPIHVYHIVRYRNAVYVIAHSEQHGQVRTFKLNRIAQTHLENLRFTLAADFDLDHYLENGLGIHGGAPEEIRLRIRPAAVRGLGESRWHPSQRMTVHKDGWATLSMHVALTPELESWILSIGADAVVESPGELASRIQDQAEQMAASYRRAEV